MRVKRLLWRINLWWKKGWLVRFDWLDEAAQRDLLDEVNVDLGGEG